MSIIYSYDKTFEGLLTLVFEAYETKKWPTSIVANSHVQQAVFQSVIQVYTDIGKAKRVYTALKKKLHPSSFNMVYHVFLSEIEGMEMLLFKYIKQVFDSKERIEADFRNEIVLQMLKTERKILREAQRINMFVRFQKTIDDTYFSPYDPQYNVLPLVIYHFKDRFADQKWIIYDTLRRYGYYYDLKDVQEITLDSETINFVTGKVNAEVLADGEKDFQRLWKNYFDNIAIKERRNLRLHMQFLPKRFWKYLPEKQPQ